MRHFHDNRWSEDPCYRAGHGAFGDIETIFECGRQDLKARFPDLYALASEEAQTSYYLGKLSSTEEAT